ncbi:Endonuclease/exonuclease/phosphatase [Schizophyllum commune]
MVNRLMNDKKIAVLLLQETHLTESRKQDVERMFGGKLKIFHSPDPDEPTQRNGVAIVVNTRLAEAKDAKFTVVEPGRALHLTMKWSPGEERTFLAIYAPSCDAGHRRNFFEKVRKYFERFTHLKRPDVMGGDFNMVEDMIDRLPMKVEPPPDLEELNELKSALKLKLTDGWRATFPDTRSYTFTQNRPDGTHCARLDRIYCSDKIYEKARLWDIREAGVRTDHSLVSVQLTCEEAPAVGKGRERLSEWVIKDKHFAKYLQELERRSDTRNPVTVLREFCTDVFTMGRERERTTVPRAQQKIKALYSEMKRSIQK